MNLNLSLNIILLKLNLILNLILSLPNPAIKFFVLGLKVSDRVRVRV